MKRICSAVMLALFLSQGILSAQTGSQAQHNGEISVKLTLISGVLVKTPQAYQVGVGTKVLATFHWHSEADLDDPSWNLGNKPSPLLVQFQKIRLAKECQLELLVTGQSMGTDVLCVENGVAQNCLNFTVTEASYEK